MGGEQPTTCAGSCMQPYTPRPMELRRNRVDRGLFWGCKLFPQCRETMPCRPDMNWAPKKEPQEEFRLSTRPR